MHLFSKEEVEKLPIIDELNFNEENLLAQASIFVLSRNIVSSEISPNSNNVFDISVSILFAQRAKGMILRNHC